MATYKIAIDTLGSDKGPETIVQGALMALLYLLRLSH